MTIRRKLLLVIALLVAFASGSSARAQVPGSLQKSNASVAIGAGTSTVPQLAHQDGYPDLPPVEFDLDLGEFIDGIYVMPPSTWLYAMVDRPKRGSARLLFYLNGSCTEPREDAYSGDALSYYNRQNGFAASIRASYSFTLDDGTYISSYRGPCITILWDTEKYYGVGTPATPIADNDSSGPIPDEDQPVVSLPNTGAGENGGTPFLWLGIGGAVLISGFAVRWRGMKLRH